MMIALLMMVQSASPAPLTLPPGAILDAQARRGVLMRLDGAAAQSPQACISACDLTPNCQAWTYHRPEADRAPRCDLHPIAGPSHFDPGAITGLSPALAARIEAGAERAPSVRERRALSHEDAPAAPPRSDELAGG
ncbi:PAN domain-containing protein [Oceanicaulis sp.]|uniref:PAN domain-containing protein n=1 Tax=Oceanicaulis sp. TaxID=1924941 RepID=UPI003F72C3B8